jgi:DNA (cytosine-5)-methyltransferase 1
MHKVNLEYYDALNILLSLSTIDNNLINKDELPAGITNWLQNPNLEPIYLTKKQTDKFKLILANYAAFKSNKIQIDHYVKWKIPKIKLNLSYHKIPFPPPENTNFTFIDLFAGIGGFRIALQRLGGKCVFSSEWDQNAKITYFNNFGEIPFGDIKQITGIDNSDESIKKTVPKHDILAAGFPCQPFSRAGVSARNSLGQLTGFNCDIQGTLFFDIVRITKALRPKVLFLENVRALIGHDNGRTFEIIKSTIDQLGYKFKYKMIDACTEVPQHRKRVYMVCFKKRSDINFKFPIFNGEALQLKSILEEDVSDDFTISDKLWEGHIERTKRNLKRGTGFTAFEASLDKPSNTIVARYGKDGKECLIPQRNKNPRMLTPRECARLMGFPENFILAKSKTASYKQFGNSVALPVVQRVANSIAGHLNK